MFADAINGSARALNFAPRLREVESPDVALSEDDASFVRWLFKCVGVDAQNYRDETLYRRLTACLRECHATCVQDATAILKRYPDRIMHAVNALLIGVTSFFRDQDVFDCVSDRVLPCMLESQHSPRIWSAGCADGAELYSIAIMLAERGSVNRCRLLGTDCRIDATRRATDGVYTQAHLRDVPEHLLEKYFTCDTESDRTVVASLRVTAQWRTADVLAVQEPGPWDLILCRNMAMYMRAEVASRLWKMLESSLRPGGYLVLGKAERPAGTNRLEAVAPCVYRRCR